jgi:hypothetical protein
MVRQQFRIALFTGLVVVGAAAQARADDCCAPAPCAPAFRTVCVTEWVPQAYTVTRTAYRTECRQEAYTAYRCELAAETRTRVCTVYKKVPEVRTETRTVCVSVPVVEQRTCMEAHVSCKPVTVMCRRCVDKGHWECREVPCEPKHHHLRLCKRHDDCCEPCCPPPTKTVKVWVPCKVWEEYPVTRMERTCEYRPVMHQVTVWKKEQHQEQFQVTVWKCVPEQHTETYQVMVPHQVAYQATRSVNVCVPHQETVTLTKMVAHTVEKQVPCEVTCCSAPKSHHRSSGLHLRHQGCCD